MENLLSHLARERGLTRYSRFHAAYTRAARELGHGTLDIGRRQFERWMAGDLTGLPRPHACDVLEAIFGADATRLFGPAQTPPPAAPVPAGQPDGPSDGTSWQDEGTSQHPELTVMLAAAAEQSRAQAARADDAVSPYAIEQAHIDAVRIARDYMHRTPLELLADLIPARDRIYALLEATHRPDQISDLNFLAGVLAGLLSQICIDLGQWRAASDHALAAAAHGRIVGHEGLAGWGRSMQATVDFWDRRPREALTAMQAARQHVTTGPMAVRAASLTARAWSHNGNIDQTTLAVRTAEELAHSRPDHREDDLSDGIGGLLRWDTTRREMCAASAYLQLLCLLKGEIDTQRLDWLADQVIVHAHRALDAADRASSAARSTTLETSMRLDMATAALVLGDHKRAHDALVRVLCLPTEYRTYPLLYRLGHARAALTTLPHPWAAELGDALRRFTDPATPLPTVRPVLPGQLQS